MSSPGARTATATLAIAVLLLVAWVVPPLAMAVVWPILFVVPGWALIDWARPPVGPAGRLGLAIVSSVAISAHATWLLALLRGTYDRDTVFLAAGLLAAASVPALSLRGPARLAQLRRLGAPATRGALLLGAGVAILVGGVLGSSLWRVTPVGISTGGTNWSDLNVHLSIVQSVNAGNFPPQVPYFAGHPLVYHWFSDFHAAMVAIAAGIFAIPAMVVSSAILAGALVLLVHALALRLLRVPRAAMLATAIAVLGGGLAWLRLVGDVSGGLGEPLALIAHNNYDNQWYDARGEVSWPYFRIPSVLGTGLLAHRATTVGLPLMVAAVLLVVIGLPTSRERRRGRRDRPALLALAGLLGALLAPFHFFFFPVVPFLFVAWAALGRRLAERRVLVNTAVFAAPYPLALPTVLAVVGQLGDAPHLRTVLGWEGAPVSDGPAAIGFFYLTNLGVPLALALGALAIARPPHAAFLAAWTIVLFAVPNVVQVSAVAFDMNKFFQAMWVAIAILAAWAIRSWPRPLIAAVLVLTVASPLLAAAWTATSYQLLLSHDEVAAADWAAASTPERSVFVTDGRVNSLTDAAGRLRLTSFAWYVRNLGYDPALREAEVHTIYCGGSAQDASRIMRALSASYVVDGGRPMPCSTPTDFAAGGFRLAFERPTIRIWELAGS